ncbi:MAG: hypothetical protein EB096_13725 [Betaproteobacteria bacterium]|nr:hypothetical protein [Betaproteobacteria bacterium]
MLGTQRNAGSGRRKVQALTWGHKCSQPTGPALLSPSASSPAPLLSKRTEADSSVIGGDGDVAGHVCDVWVDRAEALPRYLEVSLPDGRRVLTPIPFARIRRTEVVVNSILSTQFGGVPPLRHADQITLLEEEKVAAYYGAGTLFATPHRQEPIF